jgi:hypothetical protein
MLGDASPYHAARVALATMHAKERAIEKPLRQRLAITVEVASGINTDLFGTFTGEIPRSGNMVEAARGKALAAIAATGLPYGIGSEGAFGPHPAVPFLSSAIELIEFIDRQRNLEVRESLRTSCTNFSSIVCGPNDDLKPFWEAARFPSHALVIAPNTAQEEPLYWKGVLDVGVVATATREACACSADGLARITTDMRAHVNPTRMAVLRRLARRLAARLATLCPACRMPGFGERDIERGLPCFDCGSPTDLPSRYIERCVACAFVRYSPTPAQMADPGQCSVCNP